MSGVGDAGCDGFRELCVLNPTLPTLSIDQSSRMWRMLALMLDDLALKGSLNMS